jgi:hypothetical protein
MRNLRRAVLVVWIAVVWPALAFAEVKINVIDSVHHRCPSSPSLWQERQGAGLREIERFLWPIGKAYLAPDETLTIGVLDVELAGRFEPWHFHYPDVGFLREITRPAIKLRYGLEGASGGVLQGQDVVAARR